VQVLRGLDLARPQPARGCLVGKRGVFTSGQYETEPLRAFCALLSGGLQVPPLVGCATHCIQPLGALLSVSMNSCVVMTVYVVHVMALLCGMHQSLDPQIYCTSWGHLSLPALRVGLLCVAAWHASGCNVAAAATTHSTSRWVLQAEEFRIMHASVLI
jgi:hypothetical protein